MKYDECELVASRVREGGRPAAKGAACLERDGIIVPRKRQWLDAGSFPVMRGGLILVLKI